MVQGILQALNHRDCPRGIPRGNENMLKTAIFGLRGWITWKRLKVEGYMLRGILQASNLFPIHATTFTEIVPGAYSVEIKICWKWPFLRPSVYHMLVLQKECKENIHFSTYKTVPISSSQQHSVGRFVSSSWAFCCSCLDQALLQWAFLTASCHPGDIFRLVVWWICLMDNVPLSAWNMLIHTHSQLASLQHVKSTAKL